MSAHSCRECGACCLSPYEQDYWVDVDSDDIAKLGRAYTARNVTSTNDRPYDGFPVIRTKWKEQKAGPLKGASVCVCVSLRGSIFNLVSCAIYDKRPLVCRVFNPGSPECREAILATKVLINE